MPLLCQQVSAFEGRNSSCLVSCAKTADFTTHALLSSLAASGHRDALGPLTPVFRWNVTYLLVEMQKHDSAMDVGRLQGRKQGGFR